jgi:hypothetical protein
MVMSTSLLANQYDPMAPPGYANKKSTSTKEVKVKRKYYYNLRQIVISDQGNRAVINGYVLKEGDHINKSKVIKIEENKVTLSKAGKTSVIRLSYEVNKVRQAR